MRLNDDKRQKNQLQQALAFPETGRSEAPESPWRGTESSVAKHKTESPASSDPLMEEICEQENCKQALARVKANKGSPGIEAAQTAGSSHGPWRIANSPALAIALPKAYFDSLGIPRLADPR